MPYFQYGAQEMAYLQRQDSRLGAVIHTLGGIRRAVMPDFFAALVHSMVGQQISSKAQETVWQRVRQGLGEVTAARLAAAADSELRAFGLSQRKVCCLQEAAQRVLDGRLDVARLCALPDREFCAQLVQLPGVGQWTAEMLLIFSLQRPDVLSYGDFGIRRGLEMLHHIEKIDKKTFAHFQKLYSPYGTVASFYLWAVAGGAVEVPR